MYLRFPHISLQNRNIQLIQMNHCSVLQSIKQELECPIKTVHEVYCMSACSDNLA